MWALKLAGLEWLISHIVFQKGFGTGTRATVTLMPKEAFQPEPSFFTPLDPQVAAAQAEVVRRQRASRDGRRDQG